MSFRTRIALVAAGAVALAVLVASAVIYVVVRDQLRSQFDSTLRNQAYEIAGIAHVEPGTSYLDLEPNPFGFPGGHVQAVTVTGTVLRLRGERGSLPVTDRALAAAHGQGGPYFNDTNVSGTEFREITIPGNGLALQVARDLGEVNRALHRVAIFLLLIAGGGVLVAGGLGLVVSRAALGPVRRLTRVAETVTETGDLSERIDVETTDELGSLASSFNTMLAALEVSTQAQRQLVADASHELRTPLTSMRTNIEVLARDRSIPEDERRRLLEDVVNQLGEMTALIAGLIELAKGDQEPPEPEDVRLDLLVADAVDRAKRDRPSVTFRTDLRESHVHGVQETLERAVSNLLDNAAKWSPPDGEVEVRVEDGSVVVRDHGPGIDDEHLPHVFDRFYRAPAARKLPGSGLGLAIVKQVAEAHGGTVAAERAPGGGTVMTLSLNGAGDRAAGQSPTALHPTGNPDGSPL
jgi:two-component system, OmpR family, sensor histidine kinase MprB